MADIRLQEKFSLEAVTMDWLLLDSGRLDESQEIATAVRVALGTDALADFDDTLPDPDSVDRRGWWGDYQAEEIWNGWPIGTKNWLLSRAKISDGISEEGDTLERARLYTLNALQPFIDERVASRIDVEAVRTDRDRIEVYVKIYRFNHGEEIYLQYQQSWTELKQLEEFTSAASLQSSGITYFEPFTDVIASAQLTLSTTPPIVYFGVQMPVAAQLVFSTTAPTLVLTAIPTQISDLSADPYDYQSVLLIYSPSINADYHEERHKLTTDSIWSDPATLVTNLVSGLTSDLQYDFQVRGVNDEVVGEWSNIAQATILSDLPGDIIDLEAAAVYDETSLALTYTPSALADSYEERHALSGSGSWSTPAELVNDEITGLLPETEYDVEIRGVNDAGFGSWSNTATQTVNLPWPRDISDLALDSVSGYWIKVTYTSSQYASSHEERHALTGTGNWSDPAVITDTVSGLDPETLYDIQVRGVNTTGDSNWSNTLQASTILPLPGNISDLVAEAIAPDEVGFTFTPATYADSHQLRYRIVDAGFGLRANLSSSSNEPWVFW